MTAAKRVVMVFGTFDFLHIGHLRLFSQAKELGDKLVVVIGRDATVEKIKGRKPLFSERERRDLVKSIRMVDHAVLGRNYLCDKTEIILEHRPDIILLGYDQKENAKALGRELAEKGWHGTIHRAKPLHPGTAKTSKIRQKIEQIV